MPLHRTAGACVLSLIPPHVVDVESTVGPPAATYPAGFPVTPWTHQVYISFLFFRQTTLQGRSAVVA